MSVENLLDQDASEHLRVVTGTSGLHDPLYVTTKTNRPEQEHNII